jgi:ketosteroid isomerase-like protein
VSQTSLDIVRRFSEALHRKHMKEARAFLHDDVVVHEAGGLPYSGDYHGPQGFFDLLATMNETLELNPGHTSRDVLSDNTVVCRFRLTFTARASGKNTEMSLIELYRISQGRIIELDVFYKNPSAVAALLTGN